jgi:hypothetical protein
MGEGHDRDQHHIDLRLVGTALLGTRLVRHSDGAGRKTTRRTSTRSMDWDDGLEGAVSGPSRIALRDKSLVRRTGRCREGLVCGRGDNVIGIDIDSDDPEIRQAVLSAVPATTFRKRGNKGETLLFKGIGIESRSFNDANNKRLLDVLSDGRFCVLPPSRHPDSGKPYIWTGPDTCADYRPADPPQITVECIQAIGEALKPFGYTAEPKRPAITGERADGRGGLWRRVNDLAIANLDKWVPQLGLYRCRRTRDGFKAVATWRPSNTGRRPEHRKQNLSIKQRGIKDFGGDRGYSPIALVMAARNCKFWDAHDWLENLVDPPAFTIDLKAILVSYDRKRAAAETETTTPRG